MMLRRLAFMLAPARAALLLAGCATAGAPLDDEPPAAEAPAEAAATASCAPVEALAAMDTRRPVPLQPMMAWHQKQNMMEHLVAIQRITDGLAREDWDSVAEASRLIEASPQMRMMCQHMGAGAPGFTELALQFHDRANAIGEAARARDVSAALSATAHTLETCTSCHATYRQEIVDAETWRARTGSTHDPAAAHPPPADTEPMHDPALMHGMH